MTTGLLIRDQEPGNSEYLDVDEEDSGAQQGSATEPNDPVKNHDAGEGDTGNSTEDEKLGLGPWQESWMSDDVIHDFLGKVAQEGRSLVDVVVDILMEGGHFEQANMLRRLELADESDDWHRAYISAVWADDWDSEADSIYDDEVDRLAPR